MVGLGFPFNGGLLRMENSLIFSLMRHQGNFSGGSWERPSLLLTESNGKPDSPARCEWGIMFPWMLTAAVLQLHGAWAKGKKTNTYRNVELSTAEKQSKIPNWTTQAICSSSGLLVVGGNEIPLVQVGYLLPVIESILMCYVLGNTSGTSGKPLNSKVSQAQSLTLLAVVVSQNQKGERIIKLQVAIIMKK